MTLRHRPVTLFPLLPLALLCVGARKAPVVILRFLPEITVSPTASEASPSRPIRIEPIIDARPIDDKTVIGENVQNPGAPIPVRAIGVFPAPSKPTGNFVADYATEALRSCLKTSGVTQDDAADLVLRGQIVAFFVSEANAYKGEVRLKFRLEDRSGALLWEGVAAADDMTWGRDMNPENYALVLANSLKKAYANLMNTPGFVSAWAGKGTLAAERIGPSELRETVLKMLGDGLAPGVVADFVRSRRVVPALTPQDLLDWKTAGVPDEVVRAAIPARTN